MRSIRGRPGARPGKDCADPRWIWHGSGSPLGWDQAAPDSLSKLPGKFPEGAWESMLGSSRGCLESPRGAPGLVERSAKVANRCRFPNISVPFRNFEELSQSPGTPRDLSRQLPEARRACPTPSGNFPGNLLGPPIGNMFPTFLHDFPQSSLNSAGYGASAATEAGSPAEPRTRRG